MVLHASWIGQARTRARPQCTVATWRFEAYVQYFAHNGQNSIASHMQCLPVALPCSSFNALCTNPITLALSAARPNFAPFAKVQALALLRVGTIANGWTTLCIEHIFDLHTLAWSAAR